MKSCLTTAGVIMPDPNNLVLTQHPLAFMLLPKVANTSIKAAVLQSIGIDAGYAGLNHFMSQAMRNAHIFRIKSKQELAGSDRFKAAFVRNPYDRIVSCYKDKVLRNHHRAFDKYDIPHGCSFDYFVRRISDIPDDKADQHFRSQYHELYYQDKLVPDFVGKFESLNDDWSRLNSLIDLDLSPLPHHNKTDDKTIDISLPLCRLIRERYADDFEAFGYAH